MKRNKHKNPSLRVLVQDARLIVCVGSGGVGKTTTAAALGLHAAMEGRRVLVITIDPARRLANALGLDSIGNHETEIDPALFQREPGDSGRLFAMMLDTRTAFDEIMSALAPSREIRRRILSNKIYKQVSNAISTAQEYIATEKLYEVYQRDDYDLIVLDTPPMKNALDFLESPKRMTRFLDEKIIKWFMRPVNAPDGTLTERLMVSTGAVAYRLLSFVFGQDFLRDLHEFFENFRDMTRDIRVRSESVAAILRDDLTAFLVIASPLASSVEDARHFTSELRQRRLSVDGYIVNQVRLLETEPYSDDAELSPDEEAIVAALPSLSAVFEVARKAYRRAVLKSRRQKEALASLKRLNRGRGAFRQVPRLVRDITDINGLKLVNTYLFDAETDTP